MPIAIRAAALEDIPAIMAIAEQSPNAAHWTSDKYEQRLESGVVLVAEQAGGLSRTLCGFICAKRLTGEWEIENIVVFLEGLRRGIASGLLDEFIQRAKNESASAILLEVRESNEPARRLYEKIKFREVGRRRAYYRDPQEDGILYALYLEKST